MNRRRILLVAALVASFVSGGILGGAIVSLRTISSGDQMLAVLRLTSSGRDAYVGYRYGSYPVAKTALLQHLEQLVSTPMPQGIRGEAGAEFDVGVTYGRLAIAAERAGHTDEAAQYMARAVGAFPGGARPMNNSQVRRSIALLDAAWDERLSADGPRE